MVLDRLRIKYNLLRNSTDIVHYITFKQSYCKSGNAFFLHEKFTSQ
jgi:hypothetical protein